MARNQFNHGVDFLELHRTGSMLVDDSLPGKRTMPEDEIAEAVTMARNKGSYCAYHCHGAEAIDVMIEQGVRTIEHASFITDESCKKLGGRKDIGIAPTITCSYPETLDIMEDTGATCEKFPRASAEQDACIRDAYESYDILVGWGIDMDLGSMQANPHMEWQTRKNRLGVSNLDLLKQATINSTVLTGVNNKIDTVSVGKLANFIVVDGSPIAGTTTMYKKPVHIIRDGEVIR